MPLVCYSDSDSSVTDEGQTKTSQLWFHSPVLKEELKKLSEKTFASSTERKILWTVNLFHDWCFTRMRVLSVDHGRLSWCDINDSRIQPSNLAHCACSCLR